MAGRRFCFYVSWSRLLETQVGLENLDDRFATMAEVRRSLWPSNQDFYQRQATGDGVGAVLESLILGRLQACSDSIRAMGSSSTIVERQDPTGAIRYLDGLDANAIDALVVLSFDHFSKGQSPTNGEVDWLKQFLSNERKCVAICPHHNIGATGAYDTQVKEHRHHGDSLVPPQEGVGRYARALLRNLGCPIENQFGLKAATGPDGEPLGLEIDRSLDSQNLLRGVVTFTAHPHLPHLAVPDGLEKQVRILARQTVDIKSPHPVFTDRTFNALLQIVGFAGTLLVSDLTLWVAPWEKGATSLQAFWSNIASMS